MYWNNFEKISNFPTTLCDQKYTTYLMILKNKGIKKKKKIKILVGSSQNK